MAELEPDHRYRLSDDERDEALSHLRTALQEGRIGFEEHEERSQTALSAVSNTDLIPLFEDLPHRLVPSAVTSPEAAGNTPAVPAHNEESATEVSGVKGKSAEKRREGRGPSLHGLIFLGGFFFVLWGIPAIGYSVNEGTYGALIGWAIFMVVFMVPAVTVATVKGVRKRAEERPEIED